MVSVHDIFSRPPTISEDTVQYIIYPPPHQSDKVSATSLAALLSEHVQHILPDHLWHRDAFELKIAPDPEGIKDVWVLEGRMRVGDCIDDEWCVVWLLRELSSKWDIVVSVYDSDGEFLLIEAADELPSWVTPGNSENRVWIHNSRLHLIPLSHISPPSDRTRRRKYLPQTDSDDENNIDEVVQTECITAAEAVKFVRDSAINSAAPANVQAVVWKRISGYPAASRQHVHVTKAYLPLEVAKALAINPLLVQKAVEAFYTRDALQLRAAHKMARFPPEPSVLSSIRMTRTAYAQVIGQKFHPPKAFGRWIEREDEKGWRWRDVGMKIACGFEMLFQESKNQKDTIKTSFDGSPASMEVFKDNLHRNPDYEQYIENLSSAGYFKGELHGSQLWMDLETQAALAFVAARRNDDAPRISFSSSVQAAIDKCTDESVLQSLYEDPDDWLHVKATDFDALLDSRDRRKGKEAEMDAMDVDSPDDDDDRFAKVQAERLRDLSKQVEEFVEGQGDVEGARFPDESFSDDEDSDNTDADSTDSDAEQGPSALESDAEERVTRQEAMDKLVPGIDPSEYGKMPPFFHANSQRIAPVPVETGTELHDGPFPSGGVGSSSVSTPLPAVRPPILPRDKFDGVDSDDESDEEGEEDEDDADALPQIVGDVEIDMDDEEEEFIEFARQALGVSDDHWKDILRERGERGAFVPAHAFTRAKIRTEIGNGAPAVAESTMPCSSHSSTLNTLEAAMRTMDAELAHHRVNGDDLVSASQSKGKQRASAHAEDLNIEAAMEAELRDLLNRDDGDEDDDSVGHGDYQLIKNFLESFKSQNGLSGPVGSLVGRLQEGWTLPRDES